MIEQFIPLDQARRREARDHNMSSTSFNELDGDKVVRSGVLDQLQQTTLALTQAEQNRILKGAIAHAAETGDAEMLSGLAGNSAGVNSQAMNNSLGVIQNLRQQQAMQQAALQEAEAKFGPSYPKIVELRGNIAGLEHSIHQEVERVKERAKSDYAVAVQVGPGTRHDVRDRDQGSPVIRGMAPRLRQDHWSDGRR